MPKHSAMKDTHESGIRPATKEQLLQAIRTVYELPVIYAAEPVAKGVLSENWILSLDSQQLFLKKYRFDNVERIKEIHTAKHFFAQRGIPIILPKPTTADETYLVFEGRFYALFPFADAKQFERGHLTDAAIVSMAQTLARLHIAGKESPLVIVEDTFKPWDKARFTAKATPLIELIESIREPSSFDHLALEDLELKQRLIEANTTSLEDLGLPSNHLLHGDYLDHNLFFDEKDTVSHVFDLEKSQYGPRAYELIRSLMYSVIDEDFSDVSLQRARLYLDTYRSIYPMDDEEVRKGIELFFLKSIHNTWLQQEHYVLGNERPDQFLVPDTARTRFLAEHREQLVLGLLSSAYVPIIAEKR